MAIFMAEAVNPFDLFCYFHVIVFVELFLSMVR